MAKENVTINTGCGSMTLFLIFLIFLVLKLTETVTWSWWIITLPLWLPWAFFISVLLLGIMVAIISSIID